jgi:hypothetical protein
MDGFMWPSERAGPQDPRTPRPQQLPDPEPEPEPEPPADDAEAAQPGTGAESRRRQ